MAKLYTVRTIITGLLGFVVGGVVAMLMAPRTGRQQRERIIKTARSIKQKK